LQASTGLYLGIDEVLARVDMRLDSRRGWWAQPTQTASRRRISYGVFGPDTGIGRERNPGVVDRLARQAGPRPGLTG